MSRERELLDALKKSTETDAFNANTELLQGAGDAAGGAAQAASHASAHSAGGFDMFSALGVVSDVAGSMMADPLFYLKAVGVMIVAVTVLFYALDLIFGN